MSYTAMLKHRATVRRLVASDLDGMPVHTWKTVAKDVPCFLDLNFIRKGKDPVWTPEAGRTADRSGVLFLGGDTVARSADRITMTKGPSGTFLIEGAVDEAWRPTDRHHIEVGVVEVANQLAGP